MLDLARPTDAFAAPIGVGETETRSPEIDAVTVIGEGGRGSLA